MIQIYDIIVFRILNNLHRNGKEYTSNIYLYNWKGFVNNLYSQLLVSGLGTKKLLDLQVEFAYSHPLSQLYQMIAPTDMEPQTIFLC